MDSVNVNKFLEKMNENFAKELDIYSSILELSQKEKVFIISGQISKTFELVNNKKKLLDAIDKIENEQKECRKIWSNHKKQVNEGLREKIENNLVLVSDLLEKLIEFERFNEKFLGNQLKECKIFNDLKTNPSGYIASSYKKK